MKRFDMEIQPERYYMGEGESHAVSPYESTNGEWVQWEDVQELKAQRDELLEALERVKRLEKSLDDVVRYLADLNGSNWIVGDAPGEIDMRQRAKGLQSMVYSVLHENK